MPYLDCSPRHPGRVARVGYMTRRLPRAADCVIAHRIDLVNAAAVVAARQRARMVFHAHNAPPEWMRWGDPLRIVGTRHVTRVIVASQFMADTWRSVVPSTTPVDVVEYPIDCAFFVPPTQERRSTARQDYGIGSDVLVLGYFGRVDEEKGVHVLAEAASELARDRKVHVLLQGASNLGVAPEVAARYQRRCDELFRGAARSWLPPSPDVRSLLAAADVAVIPSVWPEPSGLTVSETLATGTPMVASRVGGIQAQLPDSPLVAVVEPSDPRSLARAITSVAAVAVTESHRTAIRTHVLERRAPEIVVARYLRLLVGAADTS